MNENGKKKREWVKTAAIVFLSVMLVLTFFSNTIMNYSLPEVATQYVQSGTITAKIRGSGTVESGDPYNVEVKESRQVSGVAVHVGDTVQKGDVLMYLEDEESEELKTAKETLEKAWAEYETALLSVELTSSDIQAANNGMSTDTYRKQINAAQNAVKVAENEKEAAQNKVDEIQKRYDAFTVQISITPENSADVSEETKAYNEAKTALDNANTAKNNAQNALTEAQNVVSRLEAEIALKTPKPTAKPESTDPPSTPTSAPPASSDADSRTESAENPDIGNAASEDPSQNGGGTENAEAGESTQAAPTSDENPSESVTASVQGMASGLFLVVESDELAALNAQLEVAKMNEINAQSAYDAAALEADRKKQAFDRAEQALNDKKSSGDTSATIANLKHQQSLVGRELTDAQNVLKQKEAVLADKQKELEELSAKLGRVSGLETQLDAIQKAQEVVDELNAKAVDATITAPIAGTVTAVNVTAGKKTDVSTPVAVLQPEGKGYTMSFSVTNEQAKRLSVGDVADLVNAWRYDDLTVTLASIKPDTTDPGQKKLLTFDISGNVTAGQTLNVSVGQKSANYDYIVPNSAIREDNNGKFILIVESRPGPLSTRYIATRVDVEVLASDDTQSAVSAALYGYEFVITTSTKPVEAGKQVRLSDNN